MSVGVRGANAFADVQDQRHSLLVPCPGFVVGVNVLNAESCGMPPAVFDVDLLLLENLRRGQREGVLVVDWSGKVYRLTVRTLRQIG